MERKGNKLHVSCQDLILHFIMTKEGEMIILAL